MCGRYNLYAEEDAIEMQRIIDAINRKYNGTEALAKLKMGEVFPTNIAPVITSAGPELMRWAFMGRTFDGKEVKPINAKSETVARVPMFREYLGNRCLIPAVSYYEWQNTTDGKIKYSFFDEKNPLLYIAGIYQPLEGDQVIGNGFTILTKVPPQRIAHIHNRMPVLFGKDEQEAWIHGEDAKMVFQKAFDDVRYEKVS